MPLSVNIVDKPGGVIVVSPIGAIDSETYEQLLKKIQPLLITSTKVLMFNMERVNYISSMGIGVIFKAKKFVEDNHGTFMMANLTPQIKTVFDIINALPSMRVFESVEEADAYLAEMQRRAKDNKDIEIQE